jgi:hypothetical protein
MRLTQMRLPPIPDTDPLGLHEKRAEPGRRRRIERAIDGRLGPDKHLLGQAGDGWCKQESRRPREANLEGGVHPYSTTDVRGEECMNAAEGGECTSPLGRARNRDLLLFPCTVDTVPAGCGAG